MRRDSQRLGLAGFTGLLATVLALALPAVCVAALITVGGVGTAASISYPHPVDTAFWLTASGGGSSTAMPHKGLVRLIRLRGCAHPGPQGQLPLTQIHFQSLVPAAGNRVTVKETTGPLNVPVCGSGASMSTVTTYRLRRLCVAKGDHVAFNVEGGFGAGFPNGVRYEMFGPSAGAITESFTRGGGTNNGDTLTGAAHAGVGLLMAVVLGTGHDSGICG